MDGEVNKIIF